MLQNQCVNHEEEYNYMVNPTGHLIGDMFLFLDRVMQKIEPMFMSYFEKRGVEKALKFVHDRLNGDDGLGGIFPAIANSIMAFHAMGYAKNHPDYVIARSAIDKLLVFDENNDVEKRTSVPEIPGPGEGFCMTMGGPR